MGMCNQFEHGGGVGGMLEGLFGWIGGVGSESFHGRRRKKLGVGYCRVSGGKRQYGMMI